MFAFSMEEVSPLNFHLFVYNELYALGLKESIYIEEYDTLPNYFFKFPTILKLICFFVLFCRFLFPCIAIEECCP